jgi:hypothetical protein
MKRALVVKKRRITDMLGQTIGYETIKKKVGYKKTKKKPSRKKSLKEKT